MSILLRLWRHRLTTSGWTVPLPPSAIPANAITLANGVTYLTLSDGVTYLEHV